MKMDCRVVFHTLTKRGLRAWKVSVTALISFAMGALVTGRLMYMDKVKADSNRVFELMIYHTMPGKAPELETIFRDVSKLQEKHDLHVLGYWVPNDDPAWKDTFVYVVAHSSLEEAKKNWESLHADPAFLPYRDAAIPLIQNVDGLYKVDEVYMRPTDYSAMK
jgi:NIPSNAP